MAELAYRTLEPVRPARPVDRVGYIAARCAGKRVLDIGCLDETALAKRTTDEWLHARIAAQAVSVTGVDLSDHLPEDGLDLKEHISAIEESLLRQALERAEGVVAHAATLLNLRRTTLVEKLRKYGIEREGGEEG
jgi:DNA-binding NtrC family response regulator